MMTSDAWCDYFAANQPDETDLPWNDGYLLTASERRAVAFSIQQFQLGEGSRGRRLLERGLAFSRLTHDPDFYEALALFVKEEQRHSAHLLRFMRNQGIEPLASHWVDSAFRRLRVVGGLEVSLRVLVTAEILAVPFYRALHGATRSPLLRALCQRILADEAGHLRFQRSMLTRLTSGRKAWRRRLALGLHAGLLVATALLVWLEHGRVFRAGGQGFPAYLKAALEGLASVVMRDLPAYPPSGEKSLYKAAGMLL